MVKKTIRPNKKRSCEKCGISTMTMLVLFVAVVAVGGYFFFSQYQENYTTSTISECPDSVVFNNKKYTHLKGQDTLLEAKTGTACDFDITSCIYGRNIEKKTMNDGKKVAGVWWTSPVCGKSNSKKSFDFCDKNDLLAVHFKDMKDATKRKIVWAGKTEPLFNNKCLDKYGVSVDKYQMDNGKISFGSTGYDTYLDECLMKYDSSNVKIV